MVWLIMKIQSSDNIFLSNFTLKDIPNKISWINDSENNSYLHYDIPLSEKKTIEWFNNKDDSRRMDLVINYDGVAVGIIGLLNIDEINRKAEFYITLGDKSYKRKGISFLASMMILKHAFNELDLNKVYLNVDAENIPAISLYKKIGFIQEGYFKEEIFFKGRLVDRIRFAIFKTDFREID